MTIKNNITKMLEQISSDLKIENDKTSFFDFETFDLKIDNDELHHLFWEVQDTLTYETDNLSKEEIEELEDYVKILDCIREYVDEANSAAIKFTKALTSIGENISKINRNFYNIETLSDKIEKSKDQNIQSNYHILLKNENEFIRIANELGAYFILGHREGNNIEEIISGKYVRDTFENYPEISEIALDAEDFFVSIYNNDYNLTEDDLDNLITIGESVHSYIGNNKNYGI